MEQTGVVAFADPPAGGGIHTSCAPSNTLGESAIPRNVDRFREAMDGFSGTLILLDSEGIITHVSTSALQILGCTAEDFIGRIIHEKVHPDDLERSTEFIESLCRIDAEPLPTHIRMRSGSGRWIWLEIEGKNMLGDPDVTAIVLRGRDITDRKKIETLKSDMARLLEESLAETFVADAFSFRAIYLNRAARSNSGYSEEEVPFLDARTVLASFDDKRYRALTKPLIHGLTREISLRTNVRRKDGTTYPIEGVLQFTSFGDRPVFLGIARDISDQVHRELELRKARESLEKAQELARVGSWEAELHKERKLVWSKQTCRIFGITPEEFDGKSATFRSFIHPIDRERVVELIEEAIRSSGTYETDFRIQRNDGTVRWLRARGDMVREDNITPFRFVGTVQDITEQRKAEEMLRESEERFRQFFTGDLAGHFISRPDGTIVACNPAFAKLYGYSSVDEILSVKAQSLYVHAIDREDFIRRLTAERRLENIEERVIRKNGTEAYVLENVLGEFNEKDELVEIRGSLVDITEQKKLEQQVRQVQKMEGLGTLAGGIAHDFNNLLGIILAHATLMESLSGADGRFSKSIQSITKAVDRGSALVRQLLTFARKQDARLQPVSLNAHVTEFVTLMKETMPKTIDIRMDPLEPGPIVQANPNQLHQVMLNLAVNARDAMPAGGTLMLRTEVIPGAAIARRFSKALNVPYACLSIEDTGTGMHEETVSKIFEPFFTTKEPGQGTGLGLPVVYGIVTGHNGFIDVVSAPGRGTKFSVYLPLEQTASPVERVNNCSRNVHVSGNETILLVEDEELLRVLVADMLERQGFTVLVADSGLSGYETFIANAGKIDLIVTDLGLPKFGGVELVRRIRTVHPVVPVIAASGFLEPKGRRELERLKVSSFLQKPYQLSNLLASIQSALTKPGG